VPFQGDKVVAVLIVLILWCGHQNLF